jgi:hypothetical protein
MITSRYIKYYQLIILLCFNLAIQGQSSSVLGTGQWVKLAVNNKGIYKIDFETMQKAGFDPSSVNADNIQLYGQAGGMLPQPNSAPRPNDLVQNAVYAVGLEDQSFDPTDYLLFFSEGPNLERINVDGHLVYEKNLYADTAYYFLSVAASAGKRMEIQPNMGTDYPEINHYIDYRYQEPDLQNILSSGRFWFGPLVTSSSRVEVDFDNVPPLSPGSNLEIIASVVNRSQESSNFSFTLNGTGIGSIATNGIGSGIYDDKGVLGLDTMRIAASQITQNGSLAFDVRYEGGGNGLFDYLQVSYTSPLEFNGSPLYFRSIESLQHGHSTFSISSASEQVVVWEVTNAQDVAIQEYSIIDNSLAFGAETNELKEYVVFSGDNFPVPLEVIPVDNQDLHGNPVPDLLIVTHPNFKSAAERLATFRSQHDQLEVLVVTPEEIYNEFSSGRQDISAIRDFARFMHLKDQKLKYLLLFGRSSYDYKNITSRNTNYVPTYQSRNSLDPIYSYNSDDFFGFLDDQEGEWDESLSGSGGHILDITVGRLPVTSATEAHAVVDKLIHYASNEASLGSWRQDIYYVADDGDFNLHQRDADQLATMVDTSNQDFNVKKIYMDAYPQEQTPNGESADGVNQAIEDAVKKGALIVNYTGHGSEFRWAEETILDHNMINSWNNLDRLPMFVTATCEFGRNDDPKRVSGAEKLITNPNGGAIALVTTTRPVFASKNFILNRAFYEVALDLTEDGYQTIGDIFRYVKNDSYTILANRNFALLGDPSMTLAYPRKNLKITEILSGGQPGDTIQALSPVKIKGDVVDSEGQLISSYEGIAEVTVFDKQTTSETLGSDGGRTFSYEQRNSVIFRGKASIKNGKFEVNFIVPKNINYQNGSGKISLYGLSNSGLEDAGGATSSFVIGGSNKNPATDNTPPLISLYMDDTSFVDGGSTSENALLLAKLFDENGINIAISGFGQDITATLNSDQQFILNDFFTADVDSYQTGWVRYPLDNLSVGRYNVTVKAWDIHNNSSEESLEFYVFEGSRLALNKVLNFPNPFDQQTTFLIDHNQPGADLRVEIRIFDQMGKLIDQMVTDYANSPSTINDITWDGTNGHGLQMNRGLYLYQIIVTSSSSGDKKIENKKMILIK